MTILGWALLGLAAAMAGLAWRLLSDRCDGLEAEVRGLRAELEARHGRTSRRR